MEHALLSQFCESFLAYSCCAVVSCLGFVAVVGAARAQGLGVAETVECYGGASSQMPTMLLKSMCGYVQM